MGYTLALHVAEGGCLTATSSSVRVGHGGISRHKGDTMASGPPPIKDAPEDGRRILGELLPQRRIELGYARRPAFARDRLPLTPMGNPNTRMLADIEKAYRKRFPEPTLRQLADRKSTRLNSSHVSISYA